MSTGNRALDRKAATRSRISVMGPAACGVEAVAHRGTGHATATQLAIMWAVALGLVRVSGRDRLGLSGVSGRRRIETA
jgi:hypothetical protein